MEHWDAIAGCPGDARDGVRWGAFLEGAALFDPPAFNLSGAEAAATDPQQRLLLHVRGHGGGSVWGCARSTGAGACLVVPASGVPAAHRPCCLLHHTARTPPSRLPLHAHTRLTLASRPQAVAEVLAQDASPLPAHATGTFVGLSALDYSRLAARYARAAGSAYSATGSLALSVAPGRCAYAFNLQGPAVAVDTGGWRRGGGRAHARMMGGLGGMCGVRGVGVTWWGAARKP